MMKRIGIRLFLLAMLASPALRAQENPPALRIFGSNELLIEHFEVGGNQALSPFRFEDTVYTNRLNANLEWDRKEGRKFTLRLEVLAADNDYLADDGLVLGRLSGEYEDGTLSVPFRLAFGDIFADMSRRTLQRNIRGVSFEFQPSTGSGEQSIILLAGNGEPAWRDTFDGSASDLAFTGLSYLSSTADGRVTIVANVLGAQQRPAVFGAVPIPQAFTRDQTVGGIYGEFLLGRGVTAEAELSFLSGDREALLPADGHESADDTSFYAQISRPQSQKFDWQVRIEQNGRDFIPIGGVGIIANRRIGEANGRARLAGRSGMLGGRLQYIEDGYDGGALERETRTAGVNWDASPLAARPMFSLRASADVQEIESADLLDLTFRNALFEVADRAGSLDIRYRLSYRDEDNAILRAADRRLLDNDFSVGRSFNRARISGNIRGGFIHRTQDRSGEYDSWSPLLDVFLRANRHSIRLHLGFLEQDFEPSVMEDLRYDTRQLVYSFTQGRHALALEWGQERREPDMSEKTDSQRFALRYRLTFDSAS